MLVIDDLDEATVERAGVLVAREHAAARQVRPELPADFGRAEVCAAALQRLCDSGHRGLVATDHARTLRAASMPACRPKASPSAWTSPIRPGSSPSCSGTLPRR